MQYRLEAEYEDGFVISDPDFVVVNQHVRDETRPHGKIVRWSAIGDKEKYSIDFSKLPDNARPIHYTENEMDYDFFTGELSEVRRKHFFGYQYTKDNKNHKAIKELP